MGEQVTSIDHIGWLHISRTDSSKSYVIGGSEEANEKLRKKYLGDDYKLPDSAKEYYSKSSEGKGGCQHPA